MKRRTGLVITGGLLLAVGLILFFAQAPIAWTGGVAVKVTLRIFDIRTGAPIANATTWLVLPEQDGLPLNFDQMELNGMLRRSDSSGAVQLLALCGAGGSDSLFRGKTGRYKIAHRLVIEADGYHKSDCALATLAGGPKQSLPTKPIAQDIWLVPIVPSNP